MKRKQVVKQESAPLANSPKGPKSEASKNPGDRVFKPRAIVVKQIAPKDLE